MNTFTVCMFSEDPRYQYVQDLAKGIRDELVSQNCTFVNFPMFVSELSVENVQGYFRHSAKAALEVGADLYLLPVGTLNARYPQHSEHLRDMLEILKDQNVMILEENMDGYECLGKDNQAGMRDLMIHLLDEDHYQNLVMFAGPTTSHGSSVREAVYHEEMAKRGLKETYYRGSFTGESDDVAEQMLMDHPDADCIVCASDHLAFCVYRVMKTMGLRPGKDIAVTGFDDLPRASLMQPSLSTVAAPVYLYGRTAGKEAVHILKGEPRESMVFPSSFIQRESCGHEESRVFSRLYHMYKNDSASSLTLSETLYNTCASFRDDELLDKCTQIFRIIEDNLHDNHSESIVPLFDTVLMEASGLYFKKDVFFKELDSYLAALINAESKPSLEHFRTGINSIYMRYIYNNSRDNNLELMSQTRVISGIAVQASLHGEDEKAVWQNVFTRIRDAHVSDAELHLLQKDGSFHPVVSLHNGNNILVTDTEAVNQTTLSESLKDAGGQTIIACVLEDEGEMKGVFAAAYENSELQPIFSIALEVSTVLRLLDLQRRERQMIHLLNAHNISLHHQAEYDALTGLLNRNGFHAQIAEARQMYTGREIAIFFLDLDHLKTINDTYGHEAGDTAIRETGNLLTHAFRNTDLIARLGGDEFCTFCLVDKDHASRIPERIEQVFTAFNANSSLPYPLEISVGYIPSVLSEETDIEGLMREADERMYAEKKAHHAAREN